MRMSITVPVLLLLVVGACAGDEVDEGNGPVCSKALYDTCITEHDCMSGECHTFSGDGFQACSQACSASVPCPDQNGVAATCNNNGICKPVMATDCRILP